MNLLVAKAMPYLIGGALLVGLGLGFAAGHRWQAGEVADARMAQAHAEGQRDDWRNAAGEWERAQAMWADRYAADQAEAERMREQAKRELAAIAKDEARAREAAASWQARFTAAKREPSCRVLMEESACSAFQDY